MRSPAQRQAPRPAPGATPSPWRSRSKIEVTLVRTDGAARLEVRDHGPGLPTGVTPRMGPNSSIMAYGRFNQAALRGEASPLPLPAVMIGMSSMVWVRASP